MFVSPLTVSVKIAELPSIEAAITFESEPDAPVILTVALFADEVSPISKSISCELPVQVIFAVAVPQLELLPPLSQLKSMLFELPVIAQVPV